MEWTQSGPPRLARVFPCGACLISGFYTHLGHPGAAECPTRTFHDFASHVNSLSSASVPSVARLALRCLLANPRRSHRPKPAFRKVILDGDRRSDGRYLEISCRGQHRSLWQTTRRWPRCPFRKSTASSNRYPVRTYDTRSGEGLTKRTSRSPPAPTQWASATRPRKPQGQVVGRDVSVADQLDLY